MNTISTDELRDRMEAGPMALFDVRGDVEYEAGHIPDAMSAPLGSLTFRVARVMNPESFVAVYSTGGECELAAEAARRLENLGLRNVYCYQDGLEGWWDSGNPVVESPHAKVHTRGPVHNCRPIIVDRNEAYGGAFKDTPQNVEGAGG
ncbi:MAG: rhodanese-like domain-containing protein [bacterium]|nr:rhodanese-like domain-containing protein [bacterium]